MASEARTVDVQPNRSVVRGDRVFHGIVAAVLAVMFVVSMVPKDLGRMPATFSVPQEHQSLCLLRRLTAMPCPTCGITRSFRAMGQGAPVRAFAFHPLGPLLYAVFLAVMVRSAGIALRGRTWLEGLARWLIWSIPVLVALTLTVYVIRMWCFFASGTGGAAWRASPLHDLISRLF